jgi:hypothetical protein
VPIVLEDVVERREARILEGGVGHSLLRCQ